MELTHVTIVVLASMVFALAGMVGYLYWQQTRMLQHIQSLSIAISSKMVAPEPEPEPEAEPEGGLEPEEEEAAQIHPEPEQDAQTQTTADDRLTVEGKVENVEGPTDVDELSGKKASELRDLLTQKGIPFGKRDAKSVLIQLLKATA
jgi:hypothetical protein